MPVEITRIKVIKKRIMLSSAIVDDKLSSISVILFKFSSEEIIEHNPKKKYQTSISSIIGKLIKIITIIMKMPSVFFIIKKLLNTDDIASPTFPPTIGINVPDTNRIPFRVRLSDELAKMLCVVNKPVYTVENNDKNTTINLLIVFRILNWKFSAEKEETMLNEKIMLISGTKILSANTAIIFDKKIENELYVIARLGFFDATIIPVITGKYVLIKIVEFFIPVAASVNIRLTDSITKDKIIKIQT